MLNKIYYCIRNKFIVGIVTFKMEAISRNAETATSRWGHFCPSRGEFWRQTLNYIRRTRPPAVSAAKNELVLARQPRHRFPLIYIDGDAYSHRFLRTSFSSKAKRKKKKMRRRRSEPAAISPEVNFLPDWRSVIVRICITHPAHSSRAPFARWTSR